MLKPDEVKRAAQLKEKENLNFRSYLKSHAKEEVLDQQFLELHNEFFKSYDCQSCRNCCKEYHCSFDGDEAIELASNTLNMKKDEFVKAYLEYNNSSCNYQSIHKPCDFLIENGLCLLNGSKPIGCVEFPYTNKPGRLWSLYSVLDAIEVCPVAFKIWERLKQIYGFKTKN